MIIKPYSILCFPISIGRNALFIFVNCYWLSFFIFRLCGMHMSPYYGSLSIGAAV